MIYQKTAALINSFCGCFFGERRCLACHMPFIPTVCADDFICTTCALQIEVKHDFTCTLCGHPLHQAPNPTCCISCIENPPPWDSLSYYGVYNKLLKAIIVKYKFSADFTLLPVLSMFLYKACQNLPSCQIILPMPRHNKRLISQGFNHVLELCRPLERKLGTPLNYNVLTRTRNTAPQSSLSAKLRESNPRNSFKSVPIIHDNVLLIDDVLTTGSTLRHASLALREQGAKKIHIAVIARVEK